jgi:hypothetical protein
MTKRSVTHLASTRLLHNASSRGVAFLKSHRLGGTTWSGAYVGIEQRRASFVGLVVLNYMHKGRNMMSVYTPSEAQVPFVRTVMTGLRGAGAQV